MTRAELVERIARAMACHFSMNRMPHMSGDPLARLGSQERRRLDDATTAALAAIEAAGFVCVPRTLVESLCEDVEAAAHGEYGSPPHPALMHKFNRDMGDVREVRRLLAASPLAQEARDHD